MPKPDANWADWYERHGRALLLLARQWCPDRADAEDAVHDAFVRFWPRRGRVDDPTAYLYRCTRNAALKQRRSAARRRRRQLEAARQRSEQERTEMPWFEDKEQSDALEAAIGALPDPQRQVVVMKVWGGLTFAQIGEACDVSPNTAASRYRYGLATLRDRLAPELSDG